jgi:hypothetical protein
VPQVRTSVPGTKTMCFECFYLIVKRTLWWGFLGFPVELVASMHFMRLSLLKAAHVVVSSAAYRKSGSPVFFVPGTLVRTWGTRPAPKGFC